MWGWILLGAAVVVVVWAVLVYNRLVGLRRRAQAAWSDIDTQLKLRYDLVPNLVEVVKHYAGHEREVLVGVAQARSQSEGEEEPGRRASKEAEFQRRLHSLIALVEAYPDLKADAQFRQLQDTLRDIEDDIQKARRYYNAVVRDYNTSHEVVPNNVVAGLFRFGPLEFFQLSHAAERDSPEVTVA